MIIKGYSSIHGYLRVAVELSREEASLISSIVGSDICRSGNRFVSLPLIDRYLTPTSIVQMLKTSRIDSSGCIAVLGIPEDNVELICSTTRSNERIQCIADFMNLFGEYIKKIYDMFFAKNGYR